MLQVFQLIISIDTITVPLFVPFAGFKLSHVALSFTDQLNNPPPAFQMLKDWLLTALPKIPMKLKFPGLIPTTGNITLSVINVQLGPVEVFP
jgi:hypothetical protein